MNPIVNTKCSRCGSKIVFSDSIHHYWTMCSNPDCPTRKITVSSNAQTIEEATDNEYRVSNSSQRRNKTK